MDGKWNNRHEAKDPFVILGHFAMVRSQVTTAILAIVLVSMIVIHVDPVSGSSLIKKFIKKLFVFPAGFTVPMIIGVTAHHPV